MVASPRASARAIFAAAEANVPVDAADQEAFKQTRAVNAFITFRVYYSTGFPSMHQKVRSVLIRQMWELDPNHAIFRLLGKAYTTIRDHVGRKLNLLDFLNVACPLIGVVSPDDYLTVYHWKFADIDGEIQFVRDETALVTVKGPEFTSEYEIIQNCILKGYHVDNHEVLLKKMQEDPEKMLSLVPDAETRRLHFENLALKDPLAAVNRIMCGDAADNSNSIGLSANVIVVENGVHGAVKPNAFTAAQSFSSYADFDHVLDQDDLLHFELYDWDNSHRRYLCAYNFDTTAIENSDDAIFNLENPFACDRLINGYPLRAPDKSVDPLWKHESMTIKPIPPPN